MQTGNTNYIQIYIKNDPGKACFQNDMAYGKYKDLAKRTKSDKVSEMQAIQNMMDIKEN